MHFWIQLFPFSLCATYLYIMQCRSFPLNQTGYRVFRLERNFPLPFFAKVYDKTEQNLYVPGNSLGIGWDIRVNMQIYHVQYSVKITCPALQRVSLPTLQNTDPLFLSYVLSELFRHLTLFILVFCLQNRNIFSVRPQRLLGSSMFTTCRRPLRL